MKISRSTLLLAFAAMTLSVAPGVASAQTIGDALIDRPNYDSFTGFVLVSPFSFGSDAYGKQVSKVSIYSTQVDKSFTPLVLDFLGGTAFRVAAIGTQRTVTTSGISTYDFGLVSGDATISSSTRMAWMAPSGQRGAIPYSNGSSDVGYTNSEASVSAVGDEINVSYIGREYSIQFSAGEGATPVPEPKTAGLVMAGLATMFVVARRRRSA